MKNSICKNSTLRDRTPSVELRSCFGIESIADVLHMGRLRMFGHMETCWEVLCNDFRVKGLNREAANDCAAWRGAIK